MPTQTIHEINWQYYNSNAIHGPKLLPPIGLLRTPKAVSKNLVNPLSSALVVRQ